MHREPRGLTLAELLVILSIIALYIGLFFNYEVNDAKNKKVATAEILGEGN